MASALARAKLARAARALNAGCALPALVFMTDQHRVSDLYAALRALPPGTAVILRHENRNARATLAQELAPVARRHRLPLLIAGDPALAHRIGADGLHLPEARLAEAAHWKSLRPAWFITAAAHSLSALAAAARFGADAALLGPVFRTGSHRERTPLGPCRFRSMAHAVRLPVYALGGVNGASVQNLQGARLAGIAAIEGLLPVQSA